MDPNEEYERWLSRVTDMEILRELLELAHKDTEIEDRFYRELEFGTGGLRGVLGAGSNRMNILTVAKATQGYADFLRARFSSPSVAVSYDSRRNSLLFAQTACGVFAANGIPVQIYPKLMPTPALSFAVRELGCSGGVMITASHNPAEYNGYKVYGSDGCQITTEVADAIQKCINEVDVFDSVKCVDYKSGVDSGLISIIPESISDKYMAAVCARSLAKDNLSKNLKIVYSPLNGTGISVVPLVLATQGYDNIIIPEAQRNPDGDFPTCPYPNPEIREALEVALDTARQTGAGLVLATDPDCDRVGCAVQAGDDYRLINGNDMGVLLFDYVCRRRKSMGMMPQKPVAVKTIVTTPMAQKIADTYEVELRNVLTGFKFIGEQIGFLEAEGRVDDYIFGFEESYGYLSGSHVRDKDAANASLLICEMVCEYAEQGLTLVDALKRLSERYGFYETRLLSFEFKGSAGFIRMNELMDGLRENPPLEFAGNSVIGCIDYLRDETGLPASNVLRFMLNDAELVIRPSGTEPKLKIYLTVSGENHENSLRRCDVLEDYFKHWAK